jgi:serine protease
MRLVSGAIFTCCALLSARSAPAQQQEEQTQIIVKWRKPISVEAQSGEAMQAVSDATQRVGATARLMRRLATGAEVLRLDRGLSKAEKLDLLATLRGDPHVLYAQEDTMMTLQMTPNDPQYSAQWNYYSARGGINLPTAWDLSNGSGVTVAVLDTGYRPHADLVGNIIGGYDFITEIERSNDGTGRDPDARDPGDWGAFGSCQGSSSSTWHGTHVAGTIAAVTNNDVGVAGVAFHARIVPVRVLGRCGGRISDISDAIVWAAGGSVSGVPANAHPAKVLNMSFGGPGGCSGEEQDAINYALSRGAVVVASAGNAHHSPVYSPANCTGVIAVAATGASGELTAYTSIGSQVDVAAPGGDGFYNAVLSTYNSGLTTPGLDTYSYQSGTSMAAPHVAAVAALLLSRKPATTSAEVERTLRATTRPFEFVCSTGGCGTGIIDATAALSVPPSAPASISASPTQTFTGSYVMSWPGTKGATRYVIERSVNFGSWGDRQTTTGTSRAYSGQSPGEYRHRVQACNANGCNSTWRTGGLVSVCGSSCQ